MPVDFRELKEELAKAAYSGKTDAQAAALLNAADAGAPAPKKIAINNLMAIFSPASIAKLYARPSLATFRDDVARQDRTAVVNWVTLAHVAGDITAGEYAAVVAETNATVAGPSWSAKRWDGNPVTEANVAFARSL